MVILNWLKMALFLSHKNAPFCFCLTLKPKTIRALKVRGDSHQKLDRYQPSLKDKKSVEIANSWWHHYDIMHDIIMTSPWHHPWHHPRYHVVPPHDIIMTSSKYLHQSNGLRLTIVPTLGPKTQSIKSMDLDLVVGLS